MTGLLMLCKKQALCWRSKISSWHFSLLENCMLAFIPFPSLQCVLHLRKCKKWMTPLNETYLYLGQTGSILQAFSKSHIRYGHRLGHRVCWHIFSLFQEEFLSYAGFQGLMSHSKYSSRRPTTATDVTTVQLKAVEWRHGPAQLMYDMAGIPEAATELDYGFRLKPVRNIRWHSFCAQLHSCNFCFSFICQEWTARRTLYWISSWWMFPHGITNSMGGRCHSWYRTADG